MCRQLGVDLCTLTDHCPLYTPDGALVADDVDKRVEMHFNELLGNTKAVPGAGPLMSLGAAFDALQQHASVGKSPDEHRVLQWHYANLEFANAARLNEVSVTEWDQDDEYSFSGAHCMVHAFQWAVSCADGCRTCRCARGTGAWRWAWRPGCASNSMRR